MSFFPKRERCPPRGQGWASGSKAPCGGGTPLIWKQGDRPGSAGWEHGGEGTDGGTRYLDQPGLQPVVDDDVVAVALEAVFVVVHHRLRGEPAGHGPAPGPQRGDAAGESGSTLRTGVTGTSHSSPAVLRPLHLLPLFLLRGPGPGGSATPGRGFKT